MRRFGLRGKLLIISSIPLIALLVFAANSLWNQANVLRTTKDIRALSEMAGRASALVHELQAERGITAGYLSSKGTQFGSALSDQRGRTDAALQTYTAFMSRFDAAHFGEDFSRNVAGIASRLTGLKDMRSRIDAMGVSTPEATGYYTGVIGRILQSVRYVGLLSTDRGMTRLITAYESLLWGKEYAGQERAALNGAFVRHGFDDASYQHFAGIAALEHQFLGTFKDLASPALQQKYAQVQQTRPFQEVRRMRELAERAGTASGSLNVKASYWFNMASQRIDALKQVEDAATGEIANHAATLYSRTLASFVALLVVTAVVVLLTLVLGWFLTRSIVRAVNALVEELYAGATQTLSASRQVAQASQSLAEGASQQAASLQEISSTLEELASMTRQNAEHSSQVEHLSDGVDASAKQGVSAMERMEAAIREIKESSDQTAKIIRTIDEIAFQTNLLALNAAVEAARAGDAGKGFAVVAEEVRNLAQRSAQAARSTSELIETSQQRADAGVSVSGEVQVALSDVNAAINQVLPLIKDVSTASTEQSRGIDQATEAIAQMDAVTQTTASSAEENSASSEELSAQAESLNAIVDALLQVIYGHGNHGVHSHGTRLGGDIGYDPTDLADPSNGHAKSGLATLPEAAPKGRALRLMSQGDAPALRLSLKEKLERDRREAPPAPITGLHDLGDADFRDMA